MPFIIRIIQALADQQQVILRQLLEEPSNDDDNKATIKAKHFYKSCVNISKSSIIGLISLFFSIFSIRLSGYIYASFVLAQIRHIGDTPLKELLKYYGGWPVIEKNWKKLSNQSLELMLGKMHGELNEHFLVSVQVAPDDKNSSVNILVVSSSTL